MVTAHPRRPRPTESHEYTINTAMAELRAKCPDCANPLTINVYQSIFPGHLVWSASTICHHCNFAAEEDGTNDLPIKFREAILAQEGKWGLSIPYNADLLKISRVLRDHYNLSIADISSIKQKIPGIVAEGTKTEMHFLQERLRMAGVLSEIESRV